MAKQSEIGVATALKLVLDQVDYTRRACSLTDMVGACLPKEIIETAHRALAAHKAAQAKGGA